MSEEREEGKPLPDPANPDDFEAALDFITGWQQALSAWERGFVDSLGNRSGLSEKQQAIFERIFAKALLYAEFRGGIGPRKKDRAASPRDGLVVPHEIPRGRRRPRW